MKKIFNSNLPNNVVPLNIRLMKMKTKKDFFSNISIKQSREPFPRMCHRILNQNFYKFKIFIIFTSVQLLLETSTGEKWMGKLISNKLTIIQKSSSHHFKRNQHFCCLLKCINLVLFNDLWPPTPEGILTFENYLLICWSQSVDTI